MTHESTDPTPRKGKRAALRRRVRRLRARLHESRRRTRVATGAAVLAAAVALSLALWPDPQPDPILLGRGPAGVMTVSDTSQRAGPIAPSVAAAPPASDEAVANGEGTEITGGEASYYGDELAGNPTASGEAFRPEGLTAAHRTLPLGTRLRVTNLRNNESVVVRVNDRGPFSGNRVIDLSTAAAREVGMLRSGTARVRLELLPTRG